MRGADKLLEPVAGEHILARQARIARATGAGVIVTLPAGATARQQALRGAGVRILTVPDAAEGMAGSIRAGVAALEAGARGMMILLADMPEITTADLAAMLAAFAADPAQPILRATDAAGTPGHPVIIPARHFAALAELTGDTGARDLLGAHRGETRFFAVPGHAATTDLDTPEAWAEWRARTGL